MTSGFKMGGRFSSPYSLGKLIGIRLLQLSVKGYQSRIGRFSSPYSLGKLIGDRFLEDAIASILVSLLPTR
jgi:hypothetical protein